MSVNTSLKQKLALIILGVCIAVVLLEAGLRLAGFVLAGVQEFRNARSIKQKGAYRILCLGESTTARQYPPLLEEALNRRNIGVRFSVIDKGVVGVTTPAILAQLGDNLAKYQPDMVIAMVGFNDRNILIPETKFRLFQNSKVCKLIRLLSARLYRSRLRAASSFPKDRGGYIQIQDPAHYPEAEAVFIDGIKRNPRDAACYIALGNVYSAQNKFPQAEEAFRKAIELDPRNPGAYVSLGRIYETQGKFPQAEEAFTEGIKRNPQDPQCYAGLGLMCWRHRQVLRAEELMKQALERIPNCKFLLTKVIDFYWQKGEFPEIQEALQKFVETHPGDDLAWRLLETLYRETNKMDLAEACQRKREGLRSSYYRPVTISNYRRLREILDSKGIRLVCVQYPMRSVEPLKKIFQGDTQGLVFVDNEKLFKDAIKRDGYCAYFRDAFAGDFGHCTPKGNKLLAENIANTILKEIFHK